MTPQEAKELYDNPDAFFPITKLLNKSMTPETARQTIEAYLELGTLKGVKVEYEDSPTHDEAIFYSLDDWIVIKCYCGMMKKNISEPMDEDYTNIKSITPIPLEPKLLEVGTKVRVLLGMWSGYDAYILGFDGISNYDVGFKADDTEAYIQVSIFHVVPVPESLLVEEEKRFSARKKGDEYVMTPEDFNIMLEAIGQAGYKLTKE